MWINSILLILLTYRWNDCLTLQWRYSCLVQAFLFVIIFWNIFTITICIDWKTMEMDFKARHPYCFFFWLNNVIKYSLKTFYWIFHEFTAFSYMFLLFRAIFRLNLGRCIYILQCHKRWDLIYNNKMFTMKTYLQHPQVSSDQNPKTTTALCISHFNNLLLLMRSRLLWQCSMYIHLPRFNVKMALKSKNM